MIEEIQDMLCDRCRRPTLITDIKYVAKSDGSRIALCSKCRNKPQVMEKIAPHKADPSHRVHYKCGKCGFKFKYDTQGTAVLKCPYCGETNNLHETKE